ncbi:GTPase family protein [Wenzhouxiangella sp. EGI_FJ10305]|uniref:GTPase family protein n=1 Tax=Wenzhouxiangella sp. EGI_FJ10305 TaxID=3243768 RepID=UPI0035D98178
MKDLVKEFGWLRVIAVGITVLPLVVLPVFATFWMWQSGFLLWWLLAAALASGMGLAINRVAVVREQRALPQSTTRAGAHWTAEADDCWVEIERLASEATVAEWPLNEGTTLVRLARHVLITVAGHFHPHRSQPLLEMTLPHTLTIIERAARELRDEVVSNIPFSHRLTLGTIARANSLRALLKRHESWYRTARVIFAPQSAAVAELRRAVGSQLLDHGSERVQTWLLREYIRKLGYHAIDLYGGLARLEDQTPLDAPDTRLKEHGVSQEDEHEPLRVLLLGRANAGKSSLINALFGEVTAAVDLLPDTTTDIVGYRLERNDQTQGLIFDTPGFDGALFGSRMLKKTALDADLILWVTAAHRPDRQEERQRLDQLRAMLDDPKRRSPPLLVVMTHIDRLRPVREWNPPYVLAPPADTKSGQIVSALAAVAEDLDVDVTRVIPVCLAEGKTYNVDDALNAAILRQQDAANRVRLLRCLRARKNEENWDLLWRQLGNAGRILMRIPGDLKPS